MTYSYNSHVWSEEEIKKFYENVLVDLKPNESDFFCIAARKKYMTPEEREATRMGDTCMMSKIIVKEHDVRKFLSKVHQTDAGMDWYTALNGNILPRSCMVFYINVNHTSVPKAVKDFKHELAEYEYEIVCASAKENADNAARKLGGIHNRMLKSFQDPKNQNSEWVDIDLDVDKTKVSMKDIYEIIRDLEPHKVSSLFGAVPIVETQGGYHILISKQVTKTINKFVARVYEYREIQSHVMTPGRVLQRLKNVLDESAVKEITINQNNMVPLPGTLQNGFEVKLHLENI